MGGRLFYKININSMKIIRKRPSSPTLVANKTLIWFVLAFLREKNEKHEDKLSP